MFMYRSVCLSIGEVHVKYHYLMNKVNTNMLTEETIYQMTNYTMQYLNSVPRSGKIHLINAYCIVRSLHRSFGIAIGIRHKYNLLTFLTSQEFDMCNCISVIVYIHNKFVFVLFW